MKKLIGALLVLALLTSPAFATQRKKELVDTTLTSATTDTGWLEKFVGNAEKVTYFITLDSSSTTEAVTAGVSLWGSADASNWAELKWYDLIGGTTTQNSEYFTVDDTYVMWTDSDVLLPHLRIKVYTDGSNWTTESLGVTITIVEDK